MTTDKRIRGSKICVSFNMIVVYFKVQLHHGGVGKIGCPEFKCENNISDHVIRSLLSGDDIIKYVHITTIYYH